MVQGLPQGLDEFAVHVACAGNKRWCESAVTLGGMTMNMEETNSVHDLQDLNIHEILQRR